MQHHYLTSIRSAMSQLRSNLSLSRRVDEATKRAVATPQDVYTGWMISLTLDGQLIGEYPAGSPLANQHNKRLIVRDWLVGRLLFEAFRIIMLIASIPVGVYIFSN